MTDELKPCRCGCGGEAKVYEWFDGNSAGCMQYFVYCLDCDISTRCDYDTEAEAIEAWNRSMGANRGLDEWCTDCKEYDPDKHCCPRWNKVIRKTVEEMQLSGKLAKVINRRYNGTAYGIVGLADRSYGLCGNCQGEVLEGYTFCPMCGARLEWE